MKPINKQALRNVGIRDVTLEDMSWGTYWYKPKGMFKEGHFDKSGNIYEWPWDEVKGISGIPQQIG